MKSVIGLPLDITEEEFAELMGKCGIIMEDPEARKYNSLLKLRASTRKNIDCFQTIHIDNSK